MDAATIPASLQPFQEFNLANAREGGRVVPPLDKKLAARFATRLPRMGVRPKALLRTGSQVAAELVDKRASHRRPAFQTILGFDIFLRAYRRSRAEYAAFFTNHVAGFMHRYWRATYPEDYEGGLGGDDPYYGAAIPWGMQVAAEEVGQLMALADADPELVLIVAASMGQEAIKPRERQLSARIADMARFLQGVGYAGPWGRKYAMEPQFPVGITSASDAEDLANRVRSVTDTAGTRVLRANVTEGVVSITVTATPAFIKDKQLRVAGIDTPLTDLGIEALKPETPGTAYHQPYGILVFYGTRVGANSSRVGISALDYAPTVLDLLGLPAPGHMTGRSHAHEVLRPVPRAVAH
jgi:hypothetical protein